MKLVENSKNYFFWKVKERRESWAGLWDQVYVMILALTCSYAHWIDLIRELGA